MSCSGWQGAVWMAGGKKVAQQMTSIEVRYEELKMKYDKDMSGMIDLKLQNAEAQARISDLTAELDGYRSSSRQPSAPSTARGDYDERATACCFLGRVAVPAMSAPPLVWDDLWGAVRVPGIQPWDPALGFSPGIQRAERPKQLRMAPHPICTPITRQLSAVHAPAARATACEGL
eukprot:CAMPEP_0181236766 /NCGR_PEP_ID=MMETSP1096-20121128/38368_1 /TAXON_ID=156174 ORGANISM="Chrysochromulina ericina, Strain CCMP281" /NCGR_SAMPLE_ID=MMETSP1096 /ASSEMBLY_ACC=CAM_ASM_000453 /LENGTH=174 /DNA_ID=CAMNT_0023332003 /DNA_START=110 /DNA_END=635 /DNA_ORIENTATION=+